MLLADFSVNDLPFLKILSLAAAGTVVLAVLSTLFAFATKRGKTSLHGRSWFSRGLYGVFLALVAMLAATSFGSIIQIGHMSGYALLAHVAAAGAFVFVLVAIAAIYLPRGRDGSERLGSGDRWWLVRWSSWALVGSSFAAAGTMFVSMLPVLDTEGLLEAAALHRYAGLAVVIAAVFHFQALICTRLGLR